MYVWFECATEASINSTWVFFSNKFATSTGQVNQVSPRMVLDRMRIDAGLRTNREQFEETFSERNLTAAANLSENSKPEPASLKRSADMASLVRILRGTISLAFEKVRNNKGRSIGIVMDEKDKVASLSLLYKNCQMRTAMMRRPQETNDYDRRALFAEASPPEEDSALSMSLILGFF